jgi:G3E family GTPase
MTPVHVVTGFLGAGKTTLLLDQLSKRTERCAVVVNDFGEARIDAQLLGAEVSVTEISGGCVCCTAPDALVPGVQAILDEVAPDRIFVEATGLARPADIVDTLRRSSLPVRIMPVVAVVDPRRLEGEVPPLLLEQLDASDVVVASQRGPGGEAALEAYVQAHWPPLLAVHLSDDGGAPESVFEHLREGVTMRSAPASQASSTEGYEAASRVWSPTVVFEMRQLKVILAEADVERLKGFFRTDLGWYRMDVANRELRSVPGPLRSGSAVDVIASEGATALVDALDAARYVAVEREHDSVLLQAADGWSAEFTRHALWAMPGQIPDISERIPNRVGSGVELSQVLRLAHPPEGAKFILVADDGMTTEPAPVADVGEALLVHTLSRGALPRDQGGPFRVFAPKGRSACANVKCLVRIELLDA